MYLLKPLRNVIVFWALIFTLTKVCSQEVDDHLLDSFEVVGTRLRSFDEPVFAKIEVSAAVINQSGFATAGDWLQSLSINNGGVNSFGSNPTSDAAARQGFNFRGLGGSASLVLVNGRRVAPMGLLDGSVLPFDIGALPLGALESVEVLLDGSAAIYGADAVGGVVNFRTRREFEGGQVKVAFCQFEETDWSRRETALVQGFSRERFSLLLALDYAFAIPEDKTLGMKPSHHRVRAYCRQVMQTGDVGHQS